ncbi:unnamed protein product (mitochondrion) [Plasmodiophora brassicae]|uniref:SCP domain-containing protein n=1 Tax=Plasmodiophora brassicae TaxID=37360 RepID=A0A0G4IZU5_PLABS|nr:hypothetical protein PBRA_008079 [Plasmodiophora brassicae]SPQ99377.1 unnamed protein product [Plasmodiophora brassicae]
MSRAIHLAVVLSLVLLGAFAQTPLFQSRKLERPAPRVSENALTAEPQDDEQLDDFEDDAPEEMCPVALSDSYAMIRGINNYRISHGLPSINISRSLMSTACAHMRDVTASKKAINLQCGLHSWASCCYPGDHSNPDCMHRKALQVTTALKWNIYNVAAYELAYEWTGGQFSAVRALDMFVENAEHRSFILQEDTWADFKWRAIGAAVGHKYAYIWFGTFADPNGDFDQFHVDEHTMELPGCSCTGRPVTWRPPPTLSPEEKAAREQEQRQAAMPMWYSVQQGPVEDLETKLSTPHNATSVAPNATSAPPTATTMPALTATITNVSISPVVDEASKEKTSESGEEEIAASSSGGEETSSASGPIDIGKSISIADFLKGLTQT